MWYIKPHSACRLITTSPVQGVAESRSLEDCTGQKYILALLARRSCLHPGMRYIARGLNSLGSPGNEIECEQVVWTQPATLDSPLRWSSYVWRRGTVPIWWGVELKSGGVGEATIVIPSPTPYRGTRRYVVSLSWLVPWAVLCCAL